MTSMLSLQSIKAGYDNSVVLADVSLKIEPGEIVSVLGTNGAGKTTMMRVIAGLIKPESGEMSFKGVDLLGIPAHERPKKGISLSPEGRQVFPNLSVQNNLILGSYNKRARLKRGESLSKAYDLFPKLAERRSQSAGLMSGGEQQMLAIARALMSDPTLLLLDEPSLGLSPLMVQRVFDAIQIIAKSGVSILLVEQNAAAALEISDRGYVLANGRVSLEGSSENLKRMSLVRDVFLAGGH
jgi:branched-chain amino acid transport system ATP-binding protein